LPSLASPVRALLVPLLALGAALALPATSGAAVTTFGSTLSVPATQDTANNLAYSGTSFAYGNGIIHINHDGADTALWNVAVAGGSASAPASGQITSVALEGCAEPAAGGPTPLTQFHFQALTPLAGGGDTVDVTTQPFDLPICGVNGAGGATVTHYAPTNFCVHTGDYVDFNDEGGFDSSFYPSGVPYEVLGRVGGSTDNSFILGDGTNNGATLSPSATAATSGFATNANQELMLQATLATGPDATPLCPGGTRGVPVPKPQAGQPGGPPALTIPHPQREGVTHQLTVRVSVYCAQATPCTGTLSLTNGMPASVAGSKPKPFGTATLNVAGKTPAHVSLKVSQATLLLVRKYRRGVPAVVNVTLANGTRITQAITLLL
jgi:hypothetical protein